MVNKFKILTVFLIILISNSIFASESITTYEYQQNRIYKIKTGLGIVTQIEIDPQEIVKDYSTGLTNGWNLARKDNIFYIKPKDTNVETNMTVRTAAHQYIFELKVVSTDWKNLEQAKKQGVQYQVKFSYPDGTSFKETTKSSLQSEMNPQISGRKNYFTNYDLSSGSNNWLKPTKVYDDGKFTYIHLGKSDFTGNYPAIFARKARNSQEMVVNTITQENLIIVNGVYPFLVLRHGQDVVGIRRNLK